MTAFRPTEIPEVIEVIPPRHGDHRGFFSETYSMSDFAKLGIAELVQLQKLTVA